MALETGNFISDLNPANPPGTDQIAQGDDHIRLVKRCVQQSFPNVNGAVSASPAQLDRTTTLDTDLNARLNRTGPDTFTGDLTVTGKLTAGSVESETQDLDVQGNLTVGGTATITGALTANGALSFLPLGAIIMWSPTAGAVPTGWALCDGTNGTPDLRGRFVIAASTTTPAGSTAGTPDQFKIDPNGAHTHTGTTDQTALNANQIPSHSHDVSVYDNLRLMQIASGGVQTSIDGLQGRTTKSTTSTGGGLGHDHGFTTGTAGEHDHAIDFPYYALTYIMRVV